MKTPHKHAELIKAWADGAEIQFYDKSRGCWQNSVSPVWEMHTEYRIKPDQNPDWHIYFTVEDYEFDYNTPKIFLTEDSLSNLKLTIDGETGKLKSAEVL